MLYKKKKEKVLNIFPRMNNKTAFREALGFTLKPLVPSQLESKFATQVEGKKKKTRMLSTF